MDEIWIFLYNCYGDKTFKWQNYGKQWRNAFTDFFKEKLNCEY